MASLTLPHLALLTFIMACGAKPSGAESPDADRVSANGVFDEQSQTAEDTDAPSPPEDTGDPRSQDPESDSDQTGMDTGPHDRDDTDVIPELEKSAKRGLSYDLISPDDFAAIETGVSWWYNWYYRTDTPVDFIATHQMQFIPMLWGHNPESDYVELESWLLDHPDVDHVLVLNEPNLVDQANMSPTEAVSQWLRYEQFQTEMRDSHGREIALVGPAMTWGTMTGFEDPVVWMDAFYEAFMIAAGREPRIDVLAFHWYDYGLDSQLSNMEKYGKRFWVTEMANWHVEEFWIIDSAEKQMETMTDMVDICESRADVERYAWFMGRWDPDPHFTSIFGEAPGELTAVGEHYLGLPW